MEGLYKKLEKEGIPVTAKLESIKRIQTLNKGLTKLFWLIAVLGISGGIAVLIASLYAAVERKRQELAVMRLIGFSRLDIFAFPIFEGIFLMIGSILMASFGYKVISSIINHIFVTEMKSGEYICILPLSTFVMTILFAFLIAIISSLVAAWKTTSIDPAEVIRAE